MTEISILIIEDELVIAMDIESKLKKLGYEVLGVKTSSEEAIDFLSFHRPDLVLCDIMIEGAFDGIEVAMKFVNQKIPFVFLTSLSDRPTLERAKQALPYGYIVKPFTEKDLLTTIEMSLNRYTAEVNRRDLSRTKINGIVLDELTTKEYEVLMCIVEGMNNSQIAERNFVTIHTVKHHVRNLLSKFGAANRAELLHKILTLFIN